MGVNKNLIKFIVDNIDEILSYQEVRNAIASHDIKMRLEEDKKKEEAAKLKQAKIDLEEQKNNLKEYELRFNNGITFIIFYFSISASYNSLYDLQVFNNSSCVPSCLTLPSSMNNILLASFIVESL